MAYIAFATATITREERVSRQKPAIYNHHDEKRREFLEFVLGQYVSEGMDELAQEKLPHLLTLKYHGVRDAVDVLGSVEEIRRVFVGFQPQLYGTLQDG